MQTDTWCLSGKNSIVNGAVAALYVLWFRAWPWPTRKIETRTSGLLEIGIFSLFCADWKTPSSPDISQPKIGEVKLCRDGGELSTTCYTYIFIIFYSIVVHITSHCANQFDFPYACRMCVYSVHEYKTYYFIILYYNVDNAKITSDVIKTIKTVLWLSYIELTCRRKSGLPLIY